MTEFEGLQKAELDYPMTFRHDVGTAVIGGKQFKAKKDGIVKIKKGQQISIGGTLQRYGLIKGAGDRIGFKEVEVTQEMVGSKVAVFTSIEIKADGDRIGLDQLIWHFNVLISGGISRILTTTGYLDCDEPMRLKIRKEKTEREQERKEKILASRINKWIEVRDESPRIS